MDDCIVIGGSVAGISAALPLARARRSVRVVDAGAPRNRFAAHAHTIYGADGLDPLALRDRARDQFLAYPTARWTQGVVDRAAGAIDHFTLTLGTGETLSARRIVIASGVSDVMPDIEGFAACWGRTVLHCPYCHGYEVAGRRWGMLALPGFASHMIPLYSEWTDDLTLFSDGPADAKTRMAAKTFGVKILESPVRRILERDGRIEAVETVDGPVAIDALFAPRPVALTTALPHDLGFDTDEGPLGPFIKVDAMGQTSSPGIFAAGDVASPMHSVPAAMGSGNMAGVAAHRSLLTV